MQIINLEAHDERRIQQIAQMLVEGFKAHWPDAWPDMISALNEVRESFGADRISRIAVDEYGDVLGWIGGISQYDGNVWELHPLIVRPDQQGRGIGRALVADLETQVREKGGLTIILGSDDEDDQTTLSGEDLYPRIWEHVT